MLKPIGRMIAVAGLALALVGCIPEFVNPLVGGNPADPEILGSWSGKAAGDTEALPIEIKAEADGVTVTLTNEKGDKMLPEAMTFKGTMAMVGGVRYINLILADPDKATLGGSETGPLSGNLIFRYAPKDGAIEVWALDDAAIAAAVNDGKLAGTTTGSGSDTSPKITASSADLAAFFATPAGQAAFSSGTGDVLVLTRTKPR